MRKTTVPYKGACSTQRQREEPRPRVTEGGRGAVFCRPSRVSYTRAAPWRVECAATRSLPSPASPTRRMSSVRIPRESHSPRPRAHPEHPYPPPARERAVSDLLCTKILPRTSYGPGRSPDPTDSPTQENEHRYRSQSDKFRSSPVAATPKRALKEKTTERVGTFCPHQCVCLLGGPAQRRTHAVGTSRARQGRRSRQTPRRG